MKPFFTSLALIAGMAGAVLWAETFPPAAIAARAYTKEETDNFHKMELAQARFKQAQREAENVFRSNGISTRYSTLVAESSLGYSVNPKVLAALIVVESGGNPRAISKTGDVGLAQIHIRTWKLRQADMLLPEKNVPTGARILSSYVRKYGLREGLSRYNGRVGADTIYSRQVLETAYAIQK